jgi:anti-sigma factor RsiW
LEGAELMAPKREPHEKIRELLALAAAGALGPEEDLLVARHRETCDECSAELERWGALTGGLRRLPTPQPRAAVVERARAQAEARLAEEIEHRWQRAVIIFLVLYAWILTVVTWPIFRLITAGLLTRFGPGFNHSWFLFAAFTILVWATGGVAAVLLGRHRQQGRRMA